MPRAKQFKEETVLEKAMELFWKKGYHATSMDELVNYVGVNRASLYGSFKGGKLELYERALRHYQQKMTDASLRELNPDRPVAESIRAMLQRAVQQAATDPDGKGCFMVNSTTEMAPLNDQLLRFNDHNREVFEQALRDYLMLGQERGEIDRNRDLDALAAFIFTLYNGLMVVNKLKVDAKQLQKIVDLAVEPLS